MFVDRTKLNNTWNTVLSTINSTFIDRSIEDGTWSERISPISSYIKAHGVFKTWKFGSVGVKFGSYGYTFGGSKIEQDTSYLDRNKTNTNWTNT